MQCALLTVGKAKARFISDGLAEYQKRLRAFGGCQILTVKAVKPAKGQSDEAVTAAEGTNILARLDERDHVWALDPQGQSWNSEDWASSLERVRIESPRRLILVVGGALGLGAKVLARAQYSVSLGPMTMPHELAALVALEQLYRACTILAGSPYHKA